MHSHTHIHTTWNVYEISLDLKKNLSSQFKLFSYFSEEESKVWDTYAMQNTKPQKNVEHEPLSSTKPPEDQSSNTSVSLKQDHLIPVALEHGPTFLFILNFMFSVLRKAAQ